MILTMTNLKKNKKSFGTCDVIFLKKED